MAQDGTFNDLITIISECVCKQFSYHVHTQQQDWPSWICDGLWVFFRDSKQGFIGNNFKTAKQGPVLPTHIRNTKQWPVLPTHIRSAKQWPVLLSHIRNAKQRVITKLGRIWYPLHHKQTMFVTSKRLSRHWVNLNPYRMAPNVLTLIRAEWYISS